MTDVVCEVGDIYYHGAPVQYRRGAQALAWAAYTDRLSGQAISALVRRWRENPAIIGYDIARFAEIGEDNMSDVAQVCNRYGELVRYATMPQET